MKSKVVVFINNMYREVIYRKKNNQGSNNTSRTGYIVPQSIESYPEYQSAPTKRGITNPSGFSSGMPDDRRTISNFEADEESLIYKGAIGENECPLSFDRENILNGIIFSEILGKPKSKRRGSARDSDGF